MNVVVNISDPAGQGSESMELLVDTGATDSVIPGALLRRLGIQSTGQKQVRFANGQCEWRRTGEVGVCLNGRTVKVPVIFGEAGDAQVLGLSALQVLGLMVDAKAGGVLPSTSTRILAGVGVAACGVVGVVILGWLFKKFSDAREAIS